MKAHRCTELAKSRHPTDSKKMTACQEGIAGPPVVVAGSWNGRTQRGRPKISCSTNDVGAALPDRTNSTAAVTGDWVASIILGRATGLGRPRSAGSSTTSPACSCGVTNAGT